MARGERIGDAYIRIHADGSGLDRDIRNDLDDLDDTFKKFGSDHAEAYNEAYRKEDRRQRKITNRETIESFEKTIARMGASVKRLTPALQNDIRKSFRKLFDDPALADIAAENLFRDIIDGVKDIGSVDLFDDLRAQMRRAQKDWEKVLDDAYRLNVEFDRKVSEDRDKMFDLEHRRLAQAAADWEQVLNEAYRLNVQFDRQRAQLARNESERVKKAQREFDSLREAVEKYGKGIVEAGVTQRSLIDHLRNVQTELKATGTSTRETDHEFRLFTRTLRTTIPQVSRLRERAYGVADGFGRAFGKGSRNDFINFIGVAVHGFSRLTATVIAGTAQFVGNFVRGIGTMLEGLRNFGQVAAEQGFKAALVSLVDGFGFIGTTAATAGLNIAALAVAIGAFGAVAAVFISALSGIAAVLTALVSTLVFAASAALPALAAAILPVVAVVGTGVAAFLALDDSMKKALGRDLKPLVNSFKDLGSAAAEVLFQDVGKWARELRPVIASLKPGVIGVARAIRETLGDAVQSAADSPQFQNFIDRFNVFLPNAVRKLGDIMGNVFQGFGGILLAMIPAMNRFLRWLGDVTQEFANWANSRSGRAEIREFFRDAGDSAAALGDFLKQAVKFLAELLGQTREGGDQMFRKMADAVQRMVEWLSSPEGKQAIADWIEFGQKFLDAVGKIIVAISKVVDTLDSPQMRSIMLFILDQFARFFDVLNFIFAIMGDIVSKFEDLARVIGSISLEGIFGAFGASGSGLFTALSGVASGLNLIDSESDGALKSFGSFKDSMSGIPGLTKAVADTILEMRDSLNQVTGAATAATFALARQQLQESGLLQVGRQLGFSSRTLVQAFSGQRGAMEALIPSARQNRHWTIEQKAAYAQLIQQLGLSVTNLRNERREIRQNTKDTANYTGKLRGIPRRVKSFIETNGIVPSIKGIAKVVAKAKELAPNLKLRQIKTIIAASGADLSARQIQKVIEKAKALGKERPNPKIDADEKPFLSREKHVRQLLTALDNRPPVKPTVDLNTDPAINAMNALIANLNSRPPVYQDVIIRYSRQGTPPSGSSGGGSEASQRSTTGGSTGKQVVVPNINVYSNTDDPSAVAQETLNRIVALGY